MTRAQQRVEEAWGGNAPDWVWALAKECDNSSQVKAAKVIGYSTAVVSTVLANNYRGDLGSVAQAIEGSLLGGTVNCPVAGELPSNQCLEFQRLPFKPTNAQRVRMFKACQHCPNNRKNQEAA